MDKENIAHILNIWHIIIIKEDSNGNIKMQAGA